MFAVIYSFEVVPGKEKQFIAAWEEMTELIKEYEGGLGSSLHKEDVGKYIAYAQWPNQEQWEKSGNNLPQADEEVRARMRESCVEIKTIHTMEVVNDLLIK